MLEARRAFRSTAGHATLDSECGFQVFLLGSGFRVLKDFKFGCRVPVYWWFRVLKDFLSLGLGSLFIGGFRM